MAFAGVCVTTNVTFGRHLHLNQNRTVGSGSVLADSVSVNPLAAMSGECRPESGVLIGTTAAVLQGRRVGEDACAVRNVRANAVVKGARPHEPSQRDRR
jgi:carbonic anhydrase/acetyltransferase-like protein (isoleucine patch superfamily)